jgi:hypothetical protein
LFSADLAAQKKEFEQASTAAQSNSRQEAENEEFRITALWTAKLTEQEAAHEEALNACKQEAAELGAHLAESQKREALQESRLSELTDKMTMEVRTPSPLVLLWPVAPLDHEVCNVM